MRQIICLISLILLSSFCHGQSFDKQMQKTVSLSNSFKIRAGMVENFGNFSTYTLLSLSRKGKTIFIDTTNKTEYEFGDSLYPMVNTTGDNSFEVLVEVNDRPNKNYLKRFQIRNDKLIKLDTLPTFFGKAKNLDKDNKLEYAGLWDWGEEWEDKTNQRRTVYNPIIYYELTPVGLKLDTSLTIEKNRTIYGEFKGYHYSERSSIRVNELGDRFKNEIKRIEH
jgi:hypothetical protein